MVAYIGLNMLILIISTLFLVDKRKSSIDKNSNLYLFFSGGILILFSGLRGDFTSDYKNYVNLFNFYNEFDFSQLFRYQFGQEIGYVILNKLIGIFTDNSVIFMLFTSLIIISLYFKEIKRDSVYIWLSVLLFITIGQYYISFNLIRQILAASIIFAGSKYLYEKKLIKYFLIILIATLFHTTALIMVPFYFILNLKFNLRNLLIILFILLLSISYLDNILSITQKYFYSHYVEGTYGMVGFSFENVALPLAIFIFVLFNISKLDYKNNSRVNIWVNSIMFYTFFSFLGMKIQMIERISHFFTPYVLLIIPYIILKQRNQYLRALYILTFVTMSIAYNYFVLNGTNFNPFYFIWSY